MKLVDHSKKYKYENGDDRPDDKIIPFLDNEFVTGFKEDRLFYSKDFDIALYKKIHNEGMTYVQAYNALGFDSKDIFKEIQNTTKKINIRKQINIEPIEIKKESYEVNGDLINEISELWTDNE